MNKAFEKFVMERTGHCATELSGAYRRLRCCPQAQACLEEIARIRAILETRPEVKCDSERIDAIRNSVRPERFKENLDRKTPV